MRIKPLYNSVIVEPIEVDLKSSGGIMITESGTRSVKMQTGKVIAVGDGMITPEGNLVPLQVKVGDTVIFLRGTGVETVYSMTAPKYLQFKENELFGILEKEDGE